ncbi:MAG: tetratricopeptide repeat protein [Pseudomonadota bacterium]
MKGPIILAILLAQAIGSPLVIPDEAYAPRTSPEVAAVLGRVVDQNDLRALGELKPLADAGDESAMALIGEINMGGLFGQARNPVVACSYFARITSGRADALHNMANCHQFGVGVPKDVPKARALYRRAAAAGFRQSICAYGNMLIRGEGGPSDVAEGLRLCRIAAVGGDANAQTDYGGHLLSGVVGERDPKTARLMFEQAVTQRQRNAAFLLAQIYQTGDGVEANEPQAREWYAKAYEWGRPDAAHQVALSHIRTGYGKQDGQTLVIATELAKAIEWLTISQQVHPDPAMRDQAVQLTQNLQVLIDAATASAN